MATTAMELDGNGKNDAFLYTEVDPVGEATDSVDEKLGTEYDQRGMHRMGRQQELRRQFRFWSITGYSTILGCSWEFAMINIVVTLSITGRGGTVWGVVLAILGMFPIQLSFAEMASIAPTSGGQYHFCSEFAPARIQKPLSYFVGIYCILGWQTSLAAVCNAGAQQVAALATLGNPSFAATNWQIALISFAVLLVVVLTNTVFFRSMPLLEGSIVILHVCAWVAIIVVLWVMAPRSSASQVFTEFTTNGWSNAGVAFLDAMTGPAAYLSLADSAVHLAEEVYNSAYIVPRAMLVTAVFNDIFVFLTVVTLLFSLGDLSSVMSAPFGQPYLAIINNATQSTAATMVFAVITLVLVTFCAINCLTTVSRQIWAFSRDGGTPFSQWLCVVRPGWDIPLNAILVSIVFTVVLNAIAIGSNIAYNILLTLNVSGLMTSYFICITCVFYRRNWGEPLPPSRFSLGKTFGNICNFVGMAYALIVWIFQFFPPAPNPTPADMNWGVVIYASVTIFAALDYAFRGRFKYNAPVTKIKKEF